MEPTLYAVMTRLQAIEPKNTESLSGELSKIESEFDKEIEKSEQTGFNSGLFRFNWDLKQKHHEIVTSLLPKNEEIVVPEVLEIKEEELEKVELKEEVEQEVTITEPVTETIVPTKIEPELSTIKPQVSKPKIVKNIEP